MPELTQQQWLKELLNKLYGDNDPEVYGRIAFELLDAYPSSPQGLAAKALVEAAKAAIDQDHGESCKTKYGYVPSIDKTPPICTCGKNSLATALEAARKAGLA